MRPAGLEIGSSKTHGDVEQSRRPPANLSASAAVAGFFRPQRDILESLRACFAKNPHNRDLVSE